MEPSREQASTLAPDATLMKMVVVVVAATVLLMMRGNLYAITQHGVRLGVWKQRVCGEHWGFKRAMAAREGELTGGGGRESNMTARRQHE